MLNAHQAIDVMQALGFISDEKDRQKAE